MSSLLKNDFFKRFVTVFKNHWFSYNEKMTVESVTQAVSNLALAFSDQDDEVYAMVI